MWDAAGLFFGLWLIPMGYLAVRSHWMPQRLGWLLIAGGIGYIASGFASSMLPANDIAVQLLTVPATIGELWIVGYLLAIVDDGDIVFARPGPTVEYWEGED